MADRTLAHREGLSDHHGLRSTEVDAATGQHRLNVDELAFQLILLVSVFVLEERAKVSDPSGFDIRTVVEIARVDLCQDLLLDRGIQRDRHDRRPKTNLELCHGLACKLVRAQSDARWQRARARCESSLSGERQRTKTR